MSQGQNKTAQDAPPIDPLLGQVIDEKYRIEKRIGSGGMGVVYRATHTLIERTVAIKMLHRHVVDEVEERELLERFKREAKTQASIDHPNAVTVHDFGLYQGVPYLVMQFISGKSLKTLLKETKLLPRARALPFIIQVAEAIHAAHRRGIVHRDLKPDNIIISTDDDGKERAIVTDFGIAKLLSGNTKNPEMTQVGTLMGTPLYMSPEQIKDEKVDARSDIYSFGVILYEICVGSRPFSGESALSVMMSHTETKPQAFSYINPQLRVPPALEEVVLKALEKSPADRQQSLIELIEELRTAVPEDCAFAGARLTGTSKRSSRLLVLLTLLLAAALLLPLSYQYQATRRKNTELKKAIEVVRQEPKVPSEEERKAQRQLVIAGLDDAVEKLDFVAKSAIKIAQLNQRISTLESPSRLERFEAIKERALERCSAHIEAYLRELRSLSTLTNAQVLSELIPSYISRTPSGKKLIPNRQEVAKEIVAHVALVAGGDMPTESVVLSSSVRSIAPEALERYKTDFAQVCSGTEGKLQ